MRFVYADSILLTGLDRALSVYIYDFLTSVGEVTGTKETTDPKAIHIYFKLEASADEPDDLWTMAERAHEVERELLGWGIHYHADRACVEDRELIKAAA